MFYDRSDERKQLADMLQNAEKKRAKIILLTGYSGVGKTGLISELFSSTLSHRPHVHVHVSNIASTAIENCFYFNRLYDEMLNKSKANVTSDLSTSSPLVSLRIRQFFRFIMRWIASIAQIYENEDYFESKNSADLLQKRDFVIECLKQEPHILAFENMQRVDMQSLEFLKDIADRAPQTIFVFEYTLSETDMSEYYKFYAEINRFQADIKPFRLEQLNDADALRLSPIKINSEEQQECLLNLYHANHGNLYQILLYNQHEIDISDQIQHRIQDLVHNREQAAHLFLLDLCYLNGGNISKNTLRTLATTSSYNSSGMSLVSEKQFFSVLKKLISEKLIKEKNAGLFIHDSVLLALEQQEITPVLYNAYNALVQHYTSWGPKDTTQQVYKLSQLFYLYLRFADERILTLLPDIRYAVLSCKYPQAIYRSLEQFITLLQRQLNVNPKLYNEINKLLIEICIETGEVESAWNIFKNLSNLSSSEERTLKARIYELGMTPKDFDAISSLIEYSEPDSHERLILELSRIHVAMRIWTQDKTFILIEEVVKNRAYEQYPEYAFVLSNKAELVDSPRAAITLYDRGVAILLDHGMGKYVGYMYTNMCMSYGYMGELTLAAEKLELARKMGIDETIYLNNLAVLDLLKRKPTPKSVAYLQDALLLHANQFERLIIHNNMLIAQVLLKNWDKAEAEYNYICASDFEMFQYGEFLQMCYQNLLFYCREKCILKEASKYVEKINALIKSPSVSAGTKAVAQAMLNHNLESAIFYGKYAYRAEFLCYWGIPSAMG